MAILNKRGFTILELITSVSIISVIAAISLNIYDDYQERAFLAKAMAAAHDLQISVQAQMLRTETSAGGSIGTIYTSKGFWNYSPEEIWNDCANFTNWSTFSISNPAGCVGILEGFVLPADTAVSVNIGYNFDKVRGRTSWHRTDFAFISKGGRYHLYGSDRVRGLPSGGWEYYVDITFYNIKKGTSRKIGEWTTARL